MPWRITGKREDKTGANTHYRIRNEMGEVRIVTRAGAVALCRDGQMPGYHIYTRDGVDYLRDNPDTREQDNIDHQPDI